LYGVYNSGLDNLTLSNNYFYLDGIKNWMYKVAPISNSVQYGTYFASVINQFEYENNTFIKESPATQYEYAASTVLGSVFKGHGQSTNTIVNYNTYTDCNLAIQALADDISVVPNNKTLGLKLYCNTLNTPQGVWVHSLNDIFPIQGQIIGVDQNGNDIYGSAGNKFATNATYHFKTKTNPLLTYYGRSINMELPTINVGITAANIVNTGNAGVCPLITDDNGFTVSGGTATEYRQAFAQASSNWSSTKQLLYTFPSQTAEYKQLETKLYEYRNIMDIKGNAILKYFKQENKTDSVLVWLKKLESPSAYLQIAFHHLSKEDAIQGIATINEMIAHFDFTAAQIAEYNELKEMFDVFSNDLCYTMLSQQRLDYIYQHFATGKCDLARTMARNVLELYGYTFEHEHLIPTEIAEGKIESNHRSKNYAEAILVYPNPAKEFTNFSWKVNEIEGENILISIKDMNGKIISSDNLSKYSGTYEWHTNAISNGLYFYEVRLENGNRVQSGKIIIQK
jgi:Secretion system C-terminal sorting domain